LFKNDFVNDESVEIDVIVSIEAGENPNQNQNALNCAN
jgi:hypothetical protein